MLEVVLHHGALVTEARLEWSISRNYLYAAVRFLLSWVQRGSLMIPIKGNVEMRYGGIEIYSSIKDSTLLDLLQERNWNWREKKRKKREKDQQPLIIEKWRRDEMVRLIIRCRWQSQIELAHIGGVHLVMYLLHCYLDQFVVSLFCARTMQWGEINSLISTK